MEATLKICIDFAPQAAALLRELCDGVNDVCPASKNAEKSNNEALNSLAALVELAEAMPTEDEPTGAMPTEDEPTGAMPTEDEPTGAMPAEDEPTGAMPTEAAPAEMDNVQLRAAMQAVREKHGDRANTYVEDGKAALHRAFTAAFINVAKGIGGVKPTELPAEMRGEFVKQINALIVDEDAQQVTPF